ncbi:MAG: hypothetical protein DIJKHBIC_01396 [Thermoanaerobaculia bacterium]|nr:hypothetical protein [Thermoanaerobaculia bacterium]
MNHDPREPYTANPMLDLPDEAKRILGAAREEEALGSYDRAIQLLTEALALSPANPYLLAKRGCSKLALERFEEALADFDASLALNPAAPVTLLFRAEAKEGIEDLEGALDDYRVSAELDPGNSLPHSASGMIFLFRKQYGLAREAFLSALDRDPDDSLALQGLDDLSVFK